MFPHERSLVKQLADKPFALIGVNSDRDLDKIRETVKEKNITWRSFWNGPQGTGGPISSRWGVTGWPTIYVLDANGVIRFKNVRGEKMDRAIEKLLGEMGQEVSITHPEEKDDQEDAKDSDQQDGDKKTDKSDADKPDRDKAGARTSNDDQ